MSDNNLYDVLHDFRKTFVEEKKLLQDRVVEIETEIQECKLFIESLSRKDDCDFNIFSPRSASRVYKDQVFDKNNRIEELEDELKDIYKKLSQVTKKIDSLDSIDTPQKLGDSNFSISEDGEIIIDQSVSSDDEIVIDLDSSTIESEITNSEKTSILKLQEDDRQRIAAELHDSVLQNLALIMHNLELSGKFIDVDPIRAKLEIESNRILLKSTIDEIRNTIFDLRPMQFNDFGFKKSLENYIDTIQLRTSIELKYDIENIDNLDNIVLLTIFRIIQELINNAINHSEASLINISVLYDGVKIIIEVTDDGIGFDPLSINKNNHFGLKIMDERIRMLNGEVHYPSIEKGFKSVIEIPCFLK